MSTEEYFLQTLNPPRTKIDNVCHSTGVRILRGSPDSVSLQLWSHSKTGSTRQCVPRPAFTQVSLMYSELGDIIKALQRLRRSIEKRDRR